MSDVQKIELFCLKATILRRDLNLSLGSLQTSHDRSDLERITDELVDEHLEQVDVSIQKDAQKMGEFYRMFYSLENDTRQMIAQTLDEVHGEGWWNELVPPAVRDNVKKIKDREESEGLPPRSDQSLNYTTFGELGDIVQANWNAFSGIFATAGKNRVIRVFRRLNLARGPIAHCGRLPLEEIVRLKLTIRDWYSLFE